MSTRYFYSIFIVFFLLWGFFVTSTAQAEVMGPGWFSVTAEPVNPQEARRYYEQESKVSLQVLGYSGAMEVASIFGVLSSATEITSEIRELARALQHEPKLIYEYVYNHIDYIPYFGSLKGATLTYLDGSGNDFDQASLMIALLRDSGYAASYEYGTMTIPGNKLDSWVGTGSSSWAMVWDVFAYGGIPIEILNGSEAKVARVWVKANIDGTEYRFDPALKAYIDTPKIDIGQALGYSRNDLLAAVTSGTTVGSDYVQNVNEAALSSKLVEYSSNLISAIRSQYPNSTVEEIVGGRSIVETILTAYSPSLSLPTVLEATWDEIPSEYTATVRVEHAGIDRIFYVPHIAGKRLTVTYAGGDYHPELRLDGELVAQGTVTTPGSRYDLILSVDHPYAAFGGTYCDQTSTYDMQSGGTYALVSTFAGISNAGISDALLNKRQKALDNYRAGGLPENSEPVLGESLNIMGLTWLKETLMVSILLSDITYFKSVFHHVIGRMSQESSYYIDVKNWIQTDAHRFNADTDSKPVFYTQGTFASALEHGILEQMMGPEIPGASTVKLLQLANKNGNKIFYADSTNFASIRPQLQNYTQEMLNQFQSDIEGSSSGPWLILPENAEIVINQWHGLGYLQKEAFSSGKWRMKWSISGDLYGGYGSLRGDVDADRIEERSWWERALDSIGWIEHDTFGEPVDIASGTFLHDSTDLTLGGKAPLGLTFSRSYSSSLNQKIRTLGYGWTHNYDIYFNHINHSEPGLGRRQPVDCASLITALYISHDVLANQSDLTSWMTLVLTSKWAVDELLDNAINVHLGTQVMEYVKLADDTYAPPPGVTTELIDNGNGTFSLLERFGTRMDFDVNGRINTLSDVDGNTMSFTYNDDDLVKVTDAFGRSLNFTYASGKISSVSDSQGRTISYSYDDSSNLTSYTDLENKLWGYGYDTDHRISTIANPLGITTITNTYDNLGRVVRQTAPRQEGTAAAYDFYYSGFRNIEQNPNGNQTIYFYDDKGNSVGEENALGHRNTKKYDGQNHIVEGIDPRGNRTTYVYDGNQNLVRAINARNKTTNYSYDSQFRLTDVTDPLGHITHMDYDSNHHLILTRDAKGNQVAFTYYPNGLTKTTTDGRGTTTTMTYDANGHPNSSRVSSHPAVNYTYDAIGRMASLTDQKDSTTGFEYDKRGLVTKITDPLAQNTAFIYDAAGQLSSVTDRKGDTITYIYTPTGKLESVAFSGRPTVSFNYDQLDNLVQMQDTTLGTSSYTYDAANRLTSVTDPHGFVISYTYDEAGNLTSLTYPGGKTVSYTYDTLNRLEGVTNWLGHTATYSYDSAGRFVTLVNFNSAVTTYGYDNANRLISLENRKSDGGVIAAYYFTLDANGNRTYIVQNEPLAPTPSTEMIDYSYNTKGNRLQTAGTSNFTWDNEGQLSTMDSTNFSFDAKHRLVGVSGTMAQQYAYDGRNRRLEAVRNGVTTRYIYDTRGNLIAEANASNEITRYYVYGLGLLAMVTPANQAYCYHYNAIGSSIAMSDVSQNIVNKYAYTPFGEVANSMETIQQPFKFVGQYGVMAETNGFYYMRARYYDPKVGRFISEDPIGFEGGLNLYSYVGNNPVNLVDPSGTVLTEVYIKAVEAAYWVAEHWDELERAKDIVEELWERWKEYGEDEEDRKEKESRERSIPVPSSGDAK